MRPRLLLHMCCAPCGLYVYERLRENHDVTGFFYNPNIHPEAEYRLRKEELERIAKIMDWRVIFDAYDPDAWLEQTAGLEAEPEKGRRCSFCFRMRLDRTFQYARDNGFDAVASTLSISPHKRTEQINAEGLKLSDHYGIDFHDENFKKRNGFQIGREMGKKVQVRRQDYCGCRFSFR